MKHVLLWIAGILYFIFATKIYYKYISQIRIITKVYIPDFTEFRKKFINDMPLKILKRKRLYIIIFFILAFATSFFFFSILTFCINIFAFIIAYLLSIFTINISTISLHMSIFELFNDYLTKK